MYTFEEVENGREEVEEEDTPWWPNLKTKSYRKSLDSEKSQVFAFCITIFVGLALLRCLYDVVFRLLFTYTLFDIGIGLFSGIYQFS